jgi:tRNA 2-thiouridine synthesizing protein A
MPATVSPQTFAILCLDLRGLKCPLPVLRVQKELDLAQAGTLLIVECTDPMAAIDLPNLARESGNVYEGAAQGSGFAAYRIRKAAAP